MANNVVSITRLLGAASSAQEVRFSASVDSRPVELRVPRTLWLRAVNDGDGPTDTVVMRIPKRAFRLIEAEAGLQLMMGNCPVRSVMSLRA